MRPERFIPGSEKETFPGIFPAQGVLLARRASDAAARGGPERELPLSTMNAKIEKQIPSLRRYAWSLTGDKSDADDLVQDCVEKAIRGWASLKNEDRVRQWMFSILHNQFLNDLRRRRNRHEDRHDPLDNDLPALQTQTDSLYLRQVLRAVTKLTPERRSVLTLVAVEGFTYEAVASILDIPVGTVMSRLSRARADLRQLLDGDAAANLKIVK